MKFNYRSPVKYLNINSKACANDQRGTVSTKRLISYMLWIVIQEKCFMLWKLKMS
jgi:hypothetical protein